MDMNNLIQNIIAGIIVLILASLFAFFRKRIIQFFKKQRKKPYKRPSFAKDMIKVQVIKQGTSLHDAANSQHAKYGETIYLKKDRAEKEIKEGAVKLAE